MGTRGIELVGKNVDAILGLLEKHFQMNGLHTTNTG